ncbi:hypothetical protein EON81_20690 [bacterium]|nr:MAG: hypothetical protein EON81_20690 [bacterium]
MKRSSQTAWIAGLAALVVGQGVMQQTAVFPRWKKDYSPMRNGNSAMIAQGLSPDQMVFALAGFREMLAGILWVRADSFFDTGNYDAILPIVRLVTILDPHQIDVFTTGMWHIAYNFTDEEQRSDRRYIPNALALGRQGYLNNPDTYELYFETGWTWYHKIDDNYGKAVGLFEEAYKKKDMLPARKNLLSVALQKDGQVDKALENYYGLLATADKLARSKDSQFSDKSNRDTLELNIDTLLIRMSQRGYFASKRGESLNGYDVTPPFDVGFSAKATVVDPRVLKIEGTWNVLPVGTRIRVVLRDANYPGAGPATQEWDASEAVNLDPPKDLTYMQDQLFVRNRKFSRKIDMSKDITMYPLTSKDYVLEFYYNPRSSPPHIQDKFGWNGEGMTDKNFLNTDVRKGTRVMFTSLRMTRDQLLKRGEWRDRTPTVKTANYVEVNNEYNKGDALLDVPSLLGGK